MENEITGIRDVLVALAAQNPSIIEGFEQLAFYKRNDLVAMAILNMLYKHDVNLLDEFVAYADDMKMAGEPVLGLRDLFQHEIAQYLQTIGR